MSGNATFAGTTYQAGVIAYVLAHVLCETKLRWLPVSDDTPTAASGEVKGPGDDARIEFGGRLAPIEVQAKHGLKGTKAAQEVFQAVRDGSTAGDCSDVLLVVDSSSSVSIRNDLKRDLDRLRVGRTDGLKTITRDILEALGAEIEPVMHRVRIHTLDVDLISEADTVRALKVLEENLEDSAQASAVWSMLQTDAGHVCARRSRRTRKGLLDLLAVPKIRVRPPIATRKWHDDLRYSKKFLTEDDPAAALSFLKQVEQDTAAGSPDADVLYRLNQHKAVAYLQLGKFRDAISAARKALDHRSDGVEALVNLSNALAFDNQIEEARRVATDAVTRHPQSPSAWLVHVQAGGQPVDPPSDIAAVPEYRRGLLQIAVSTGDGPRARELSALLIAEGDRSAFMILLRVGALLMDVDQATAEERRGRATDVERLCTELLDDELNRADRQRQRAFVGRSVARRLLGRPDSEILSDIEQARDLSPDDSRILIEAAQARIHANDYDGALDMLTGSAVEETPFLLAMRAGLLAGRGDSVRAQRDLDAVLQAIPDAHQPDILRSAAAEVALQLKDLPLARRLLAESSTEHSRSAHHLVLLGRVAALEGDFTAAEDRFREAAALDVLHASDLLAELGTCFLRAKKPEEAVRLFHDAIPFPPKAEQHYVHALVAVDRLADAQERLDRLAADGHMADWAVAFAAQIAVRRNDPVKAAAHLEDLIARGTATADGKLVLMQTLITLEQPDRARVHAEALTKEEGLSPSERMRLAHLLIRLKEPAKALDAALRAYRAAPDAEMSRALASAVFFAKTPPVEPDRIGPDTYAELKADDGKTLEYLIFGGGAAHRLPNEISLADADGAGLVDLRVGDVFVQNRGAFFEKRWRVEQIQSALRHVFNDIVGNYGDRFPNAPFFAVGFRVNPDAPSVADVQPMIDSSYERDRHQKQVLDMYRDRVLPLGFVANMAQVSVPVLMSELSRADGGRPLFVEWSDDEGPRVSRAAARLNDPVVLTRSALVTVDAFKLSDLVVRNYKCIAPRSLRDELKAELGEAQERVDEGQTLVASSGERGLVIHKQDAGDPVLVRRRDRSQELLDWADANIEFLPRPLEAFGDTRTLDGETRAHMGESANDAIEVAIHACGTLYADDLGLRGIGVSLGLRSFSTVALVQVLAERGLLKAEERDRLLIDMVERHYNAVAVSPELLVEAMAPTRTAHARQETFSLLSAPAIDAAQAARVVVRAVKIATMMPVRTTTAAEIARHGLAGMAHRFAVPLTAQLVSRMADDELTLLPTDLHAVKKASAQFRQRRRPNGEFAQPFDGTSP